MLTECSFHSTACSKGPVGVCMVGLHCCGDLTPTVLRLFTSGFHPSLRSLILLGCCYHKMSAFSTNTGVGHSGDTHTTSQRWIENKTYNLMLHDPSLSPPPLPLPPPSPLLPSPSPLPLPAPPSFPLCAVLRGLLCSGSHPSPPPLNVFALRLAAQETRAR